MPKTRPAVLCFSGHDPSGGAGIQADIETLASHQCHACTVITALTEQDSHNAYKIIPQHPQDFIDQAKRVLTDINIDAFKIGLIASPEIALTIAEILLAHPKVPVVFDPVLAAGGGTAFADDKLQQIIFQSILPNTTVLTPNSVEARKLAAQQDLDRSALRLLEQGCQYVLITGGHEPDVHLCNRLYHQQRCIERYTWDRLEGEFHGSGCTLASSIAALLAHGLDVTSAVNEAQEYTWNTLNSAYQAGGGQLNPNRLFWSQDEP
jgi:hydroxymethylpyrimidine/phosphomethylpyrimidine kinase